MISPALRAEVCQANLRLVSAGLVTLSWGNASGVDRIAGAMVIKPSGVPYETLGPDDMVVVSLRDGSVLEGDLRPSSDTPTHLALYRRYPTLAGIVHTHSTQATAWAQAGRDIPVFGTTHADHFRGPVPVSRQLTDAEIEGAYEAETGKVIIETIDSLVDDPLRMTAILVRSHGPFTWGRSPAGAVEAAIALELVATMALHVLALDPAASPVPEALLRRHFDRKHGPGAYYGQPGTTT
jgi:L-ribulose-5-phosphate 4-epimerase